jgi:hypothetical protein
MSLGEKFALGCAVAGLLLGAVKAFQTKGQDVLAFGVIVLAIAVLLVA